MFDVLVDCLNCKIEWEITVPKEARKGLKCPSCGSEKVDWEKI